MKYTALIIIVMFTISGKVAAEQKSTATQAKKTIFLKSDFNDSTKSVLDGKEIDPIASNNLQYIESDFSKALVISKDTKVKYELTNGFPFKNGSLEIRFRPDFPQTKDQPERTVLTMTISGGYKLDLTFKPNGLRWIYTLSHKRWHRNKELIVWHGQVKEKKWNHLLLTWNKEEKRLDLYLDGKFKYKAIYDTNLKGKVIIELGGAIDSQISIDELVVYNRTITVEQAPVLAASFEKKEKRPDEVQKQLDKDDLILQKRREKVAMLKGKVGYVMHNRSSKTKTFQFPEDITATCIRPQDIGKTDLSQFKVLWFPKGPKFQIKPDQYKYIQDYVKNGGGYVGSCQGSFFAEKLGLLDFKACSSNIWGIYLIHLSPHVVDDFQKKQIHMHFGNGPIMVPGKGCTTIAKYHTFFPDKTQPSAIITGQCGEGRVVLFGPHPTGGVVTRGGVRAYWSGRDLGTNRMVVNALLYAAKIIDNNKNVE